MKRYAFGLALAAVVGGVLFASATAAPLSCVDLKGLRLTNGEILSADPVEGGRFDPPAGVTLTPETMKAMPAFCRIRAKLTPSSDSDIRIEVWLPTTAWNGKYRVLGNGGLAGVVPYAGMAAALQGGYATAGTDTGHVGDNADFVRGHPEKLRDFGYRAIHELTVAGKAIVAARYETPPARSYFDACSTGGRQALIEAQRFPDDFDGIVAGASAWDQMRLYAARIALNLFVNREADGIIPAAKFPMIHAAVLNACDALDGVRDGVIEDPSRCRFDYGTLACAAGNEPACLTRGQVESARAITSPITDRTTGEVLFAGRLYPGSELGWNWIAGPTPSGEWLAAMKNIVFTPAWDYHSLRVPDDVTRAVRADEGLLFGGDPDLRQFFGRGGKLLMYHGWADPLVSPDTSLMFYRNVREVVGPSAEGAMALFLVPGMGHCGGGPGTDSFGTASAIDQWVETGRKPQQMIADHRSGAAITRSRPLCAYPRVARYIGTGSTDDAANFRCEVAR
jgi:feruloyl esterase